MEWRAFRAALAGLVVFGVLVPSTAHAYLDAGTGSLIVQALLGGVVGVATVAKLYWGRIRSLWSRGGKSETTIAGDDRR